MKILHTSDWHLGKTLNNITRYEEQQEFIDEIAEIAKEENVDIILISGDIYDTSNPSAMAENMFFNSAVRLAQNGTVPVMVIAGNHDSPDRLLAGADILKVRVWLAKYLLIPVTVTDPVPVFVLSAQERT